MLAAHAGDYACTYGIGTDLTCQIHLNCRIYGHHLRIPCDAERVVCPGYILEQQILAIVHILIQPLGAEGKRSHGYARTDLLPGIVYHPAFKKRQDSVRHGFRMQPEMLMVLKGGENGIRDASHTYLQGRPVRNKLSYMTAYGTVDLRRHGCRNLHKRVVSFDGRIYPGDMDKGVAIGIRHGLVDLDYHFPRTLHGRDREIGRDAERTETVLVRRRNIQEHGIERKGTVTEKAGYLTKKRRNGGTVSICKPASYVIGYKKTLHIEGLLVFRSAERSLTTAYGKSGIDGHILQFVSPVRKGLREHFRYRCAALDIDAVAGFYQLDGLGCRYVFHTV